MSQDLAERCAELVAELGLANPGTDVRIRPLTGGVASDIAVVETEQRDVVVKFALAKLKVAEDWFAPVHRNRAEYAWLKFAHDTCPANAPKIFGRSEALQGFAMELLKGEHVYLWKDRLLSGAAPDGEAAKVGGLLGRLHAVSSRTDFDRSAFRNRDDFHALRLEPYLSFTAGRHPDLAMRINGLAEALHGSDQVLVHGDVSPKNILVRDGTPILLDAECATMGDASFDLAFCLNHLVLKALHMPTNRDALCAEAQSLWNAYAPHVCWEAAADLEARTVALLPALMLARVDGKSPVEYLDETGRRRVRTLSRPLIAEPAATISDFIDILKKQARHQ
ncbi:Ser/Thr protein kinase RdoA (MazF antagonist) [Aliiruegeria haliotis]|uniref:Ser/Thr protein kinase RdoA (MazF antagonist) n=1 Tax=Aliiruegeria haliotis TaxID=1280846 RepID=A0A2T0RI81_9RHOB|nr:aminoglycoside phosphotransferase family protein [Aliiruegeria haliotis]PRY20868.1 Ser/Thr protein kinase RdoA (MazF antagonist) [Aliiruegeria haliotis]